MRRLLALLFLAVLLAGCAGIPSSSAPQAIGTVERPAPSNLPKPSPGMDPDVLLREFLKDSLLGDGDGDGGGGGGPAGSQRPLTERWA
ncbi:MAG: hypothetical protein ACLQLO_33760, partial [Mycobacterium sp.]